MQPKQHVSPNVKITGPLARPALLLAWLNLARPKFYPLMLFILGAGAVLAARQQERPLSWLALTITAFCAILVEFITVLTNEISDQDSDQMNRNAGPFNGGSRVIVSGRLCEEDANRVRFGAAILLGLVSVVLWPVLEPSSRWPMCTLAIVGLSLGVSYSMPPFRLVGRGWGELTVAAAHGFVAFFAGFLSQSGPLEVASVCLPALPIFASILPSIILSGIPDVEADEATGKRTLAVRLGVRAAAWQAFIVGTAAWALLTVQLEFSAGSAILFALATVHLAFLCGAIRKYLKSGCSSGRQDELIAISLAYVLWFPSAIYSDVLRTVDSL